MLPWPTVLRPRHFPYWSIWLLPRMVQFERFSIVTDRRLTVSHSFLVLRSVLVRLLITTLGLARIVLAEDDIADGVNTDQRAMSSDHGTTNDCNNAAAGTAHPTPVPHAGEVTT